VVAYRWAIFWADLNPVLGSEQAGRRPVLVVSSEEVNQALPTLTVMPLSSARPGRRVYPTEVLLSMDITGLPKDSLVLTHQIRTIAKERLREKCGEVRAADMQDEIWQALRRYLGM
jgi:mRNA interferase MazF